MNNKRRLIRLNVGDFIEIRSLNEEGRAYPAKAKDFTLMGICFVSEVEWKKGQILFIDYFIPEELDSVRLKMMVIWSEFVDPDNGYFCGGQIIDVEEDKQDKFANYYYKQLKGKFFK